MSLSVRARCTRRRLAGGPLVRLVDRVEAGAALTAAALLIVAGFFAAQVSTSVRTDHMHAVGMDAANRHPIEAVALERSQVKPQRPITTFTVPVQWFANGGTRDKTVEIQHPVKAGDRVRLWIDAQGNAVSAPRSEADARASGVGAGLGFWLLSLCVVATALVVLRRALNRVRYRAWDRGLLLLVGKGGGSTAYSP
ncbi:Rv1733c family protein [Mycolicibacterium baixiangningiae]|uniref:Rv1733c family protein n=1 Tax=Mycolicibacterium baixiangningiae TaxID=2761578 RepID=UPI003FD78137